MYIPKQRNSESIIGKGKLQQQWFNGFDSFLCSMCPPMAMLCHLCHTNDFSMTFMVGLLTFLQTPSLGITQSTTH